MTHLLTVLLVAVFTSFGVFVEGFLKLVFEVGFARLGIWDLEKFSNVCEVIQLKNDVASIPVQVSLNPSKAKENERSR